MNTTTTKEKHWQYNQGKFVEVDEVLICKGGDELGEALRGNGYSDTWCYLAGDTDTCHLATYRKADESEEWIGTVSTESELFIIHLPDLPSWMMFVKDYGPVFSLGNMRDMLEHSISQVLEKAFHAWHGHYSEDACPECDPGEHQRNQYWDAERKAKKQERAALKTLWVLPD